MSLKVTSCMLAMVLLSLIAVASHAAERVVFNCFLPPSHYMCTQFLPELKHRIEIATEGRVKVNTPPKTLSSPADQYDSVVGGVMDGAIQFNALLANQVPGIQFSLLPFISGSTAEVAGPALWETYQKFFAGKNEYGDAVLISVHASTGNEFFSMNDTPITTLEDIGSRKMWGVPGVVAKTLKGTGSSVVAGPAVQMYEMISKGVVDGYAGVPWGAVAAFKLEDYTESATEFEIKLSQPTFSFMIAKAKWDKFSSKDQTAIMEVMGSDFARWTGALQDKINEEARAEMMHAGVKIIKGSEALERDLRDIGKPITEAWIAKMSEMDVDGQAVIDFYLELLAAGAAVDSN